MPNDAQLIEEIEVIDAALAERRTDVEQPDGYSRCLEWRRLALERIDRYASEVQRLRQHYNALIRNGTLGMNQYAGVGGECSSKFSRLLTRANDLNQQINLLQNKLTNLRALILSADCTVSTWSTATASIDELIMTTIQQICDAFAPVNDLNTELDEIRRTCPIKLPDEPEFLVPDPTLELGRLETIRPR